MTEDAVTRAIQSAAREAFAMGIRAKEMRGSDRERMKQSAIGYAEDLVLPMVGLAIQEALEAQWIEEHGKRQSGPGSHIMSAMQRPSCREVASLLLAHRWLQDRGYDLRSLRFAKREAGRVNVGLVWQRGWDGNAAVRNATLTREQAAELLLGLGGLAVL